MAKKTKKIVWSVNPKNGQKLYKDDSTFHCSYGAYYICPVCHKPVNPHLSWRDPDDDFQKHYDCLPQKHKNKN